MSWCRVLLLLILFGGTPLAAAPLLSTDPPPSLALRNPIDMKITLTLSPEDARVLDWRNPRVVIDGFDLTKSIQPLLEGALAVPVGDQAVVMDQKLEADRLEMRIYGFIAPIGPHQVVIELPRKGSAPLRYQAQYVVIP